MTFARVLFFALLPVLLSAQPVSARETPMTEAALPAPGSLFDPARHMRVSEVKPGMTGYGLTVFRGTKIERFDVEVISILRNFNPKCDVVLIRAKGDYLEHTGSIAGMSGSPIFLRDDQGRSRMIGAFAYGWPLTKDPLAGVQPIEYMLSLPGAKPEGATARGTSATRPSSNKEPADVTRAQGRIHWTLQDAGVSFFPKRLLRPAAQAEATLLSAGARLGDGDQAPRLQPLATPLMTSGLSPKLFKELSPALASAGLTPLQSGIGGSATGDEPAAVLEPGSVLAVPLLTGDTELTAIGTCTEVLGQRVFGFGHPFNNEGAVVLPMGSGQISSVIPNLSTSFKLGSLTQQRGRLTTDQTVGVAGEMGRDAPMVPLEFTINYTDGSPSRSYHFRSALHPKLTPMIAGLALSSAISGASELPQYNTLDFDLNLEFANEQTIHIADRSVNTTPSDLLGELQVPISMASDNPFERVPIRKITGSITVTPEAHEAQILEVNVPRSKYRPGETVKGFVTYKPFRAPQGTMPVELELPRDLPQGTYQLIISDAARFFQDEQQSKPFRFTAEKVDDVFAVLKDLVSIRQNALYVRLLRQADGVAIGRTAMPQLPSSRRQILMGAGRSTTTAFISSTTRSIPVDQVMSGSAEFSITIDTSAKVAVPSAKPVRPEPVVPLLKSEEARPKGATADAPAPKETNPVE